MKPPRPGLETNKPSLHQTQGDSTLQVRVDAVGCDGGTLLYDAPITDTATVTVNATDLTSTETRIEACVTAGIGWGSSVIYLTGGTAQRTTLRLAPFADTGVSNADGLTAARELTFHGLAAPDATVELLADGGVAATTQADFFGEFAFDVAPPTDGQHVYTAVTSAGVASAPANITYVSAGPIVTVAPPGANPQSISYSTDATSEACYLNTVPVPCGSPVDVSFLGDGEHVFQMEAYNDAGAVTLVQQAFTNSIAIGQPPIANNDTAETESGEPVVVDVLVNDTDPDNDLDPGSLSVRTNPANGTALVVGDPLEGLEIEYEPTPGFAGIDQFDYQVCDLEGSCATGTVTVNVLASASPPDAVDDNDEAETDETVTIDVLENDSDPDDDINDASLTIITPPGNGTAAVVNDPADGVAIDYTPATGFAGSDSFTYQICDDTGLCDTATVTILVGSASCTIIGTAGDDTLNGTEGDDIICGLGGDDVINGGGGNDIIRGGRGADTLNGQAGNDTIYGGNGNDTIKGQAGDDQIYGGRGADSLDGGAGNDTIRGNRGADTITGGAGEDTLYSGAGNDTIDGGNGADTIRGYRGADTLSGGAGADAIYGGRGADVIHGDEGPDLLHGRRGADTLFGDDGNDQIHGEKGPDVIDGGNGRDSIYGGDGGDTIQGGPGADNIYGRQGADSLDGGPGNDLANGGPGNDSCVAETRKQCET